MKSVIDETVRLVEARRAFSAAESDSDRAEKFAAICALHAEIEAEFDLETAVRIGTFAKVLPQIRVEYGMSSASVEKVFEAVDRAHIEHRRKYSSLTVEQRQFVRAAWEARQANLRAEMASLNGDERGARAWRRIARDNVFGDTRLR